MTVPSALTQQLDPNVVHDIRVGVDGHETRTMGPVDYDLACGILGTKPPRTRGPIRAENGAFDVAVDYDDFEVFDGMAHMVSPRVEPGTLCYEYVAVAVSDPENWTWIKLSVRGGPFDGLCCLGVKHETEEAVVVALAP